MKNGDYNLTDLDELMEYMWLRPRFSGLGVDIFIDDCSSYERYDHPLLLFVRNGYDRSVSEFIPITISEKPSIIDGNIEVKVSDRVIKKVMMFIVNNINLFFDLTQSRITHDEFGQ